MSNVGKTFSWWHHKTTVLSQYIIILLFIWKFKKLEIYNKFKQNLNFILTLSFFNSCCSNKEVKWDIFSIEWCFLGVMRFKAKKGGVLLLIKAKSFTISSNMVWIFTTCYRWVFGAKKDVTKDYWLVKIWDRVNVGERFRRGIQDCGTSRLYVKIFYRFVATSKSVYLVLKYGMFCRKLGMRFFCFVFIEMGRYSHLRYK